MLDTFDAGEADNKPGSSTPAALVHAGADFTLGDLLSDDLAGLSPPGAHPLLLKNLILFRGVCAFGRQGVMITSCWGMFTASVWLCG